MGRMTATRKLSHAEPDGPEVLYKGMSSEKHFSPLECQKCFPDIQPVP